VIDHSPWDDADLRPLCETLGEKLLARQWHVATAESCTGGAIAAAITQVAGSSGWFECGIVSYTNRIKQKLLQISAETLNAHSAVSEDVVIQMANSVIGLAGADVAVAVSGIAGPTGGSINQPVGTVWFAWVSAKGEIRTQRFHFSGDRLQVQHQAVKQGLLGLLNFFD
jgi:nicotinamide-nucleotide amidase